MPAACHHETMKSDYLILPSYQNALALSSSTLMHTVCKILWCVVLILACMGTIGHLWVRCAQRLRRADAACNRWHPRTADSEPDRLGGCAIATGNHCCEFGRHAGALDQRQIQVYRSQSMNPESPYQGIDFSTSPIITQFALVVQVHICPNI